MSQLNNTGSSQSNENTLVVEKQAAQHITNLSPQADDLIQLEFGDEVPLVSRDENDLIFEFDDGSVITLEEFYTLFTAENMPDFLVDGGIVDGESFFAVLESPDLMPAAGPAPTASNDGLNATNTSNPDLFDPQLRSAPPRSASDNSSGSRAGVEGPDIRTGDGSGSGTGDGSGTGTGDGSGTDAGDGSGTDTGTGTDTDTDTGTPANNVFFGNADSDKMNGTNLDNFESQYDDQLYAMTGTNHEGDDSSNYLDGGSGVTYLLVVTVKTLSKAVRAMTLSTVAMTMTCFTDKEPMILCMVKMATTL